MTTPTIPSREGRTRQEFEAWISAPPFELEIDRYPNDETKYAWPGHYRNYKVELAWCALSAREERVAALEAEVARLQKAKIDACKDSERLREWAQLSDSALRLRCGEMSAQEIRTVRAVLKAITQTNQ